LTVQDEERDVGSAQRAVILGHDDLPHGEQVRAANRRRRADPECVGSIWVGEAARAAIDQVVFNRHHAVPRREHEIGRDQRAGTQGLRFGRDGGDGEHRGVHAVGLAADDGLLKLPGVLDAIATRYIVTADVPDLVAAHFAQPHVTGPERETQHTHGQPAAGRARRQNSRLMPSDFVPSDFKGLTSWGKERAHRHLGFVE
jgi:hypothetical protein